MKIDESKMTNCNIMNCTIVNCIAKLQNLELQSGVNFQQINSKLVSKNGGEVAKVRKQ
jgi:hypothetical protein